MGKIVITTNMSLDGVIEDPDGMEGSRLGGWFGQFGGADLEAWTAVFMEESLQAQAILLGRRSDRWFAERWNARTGEWADRLNGMPKHVVSTTLEEPAWQNATVITGDVPGHVAKLKQDATGDILVYASYQLAHTLLEHDLVDEVRVVVFPVVLGDGARLFGSTSSAKPLRLLSTRPVGEGLAFLAYEVVR